MGELSTAWCARARTSSRGITYSPCWSIVGTSSVLLWGFPFVTSPPLAITPAPPDVPAEPPPGPSPGPPGPAPAPAPGAPSPEPTFDPALFDAEYQFQKAGVPYAGTSPAPAGAGAAMPAGAGEPATGIAPRS